MAKTKHFHPLEQNLLHLEQRSFQISLSVADIIEGLSGKEHCLGVILLSLPFCQPIQIPGLSILFGLAIAAIGLKMAFGKKIRLPKRVLARRIPSKTLRKITSKTLRLFSKLRPWMHPRLFWASQPSFMKKINGLMIFLLGLFLALPLPIPFTNLATAWSLLLLGLGTLEGDGVFVLIGHGLACLTLLLFLSTAFAVKHVL